jgi:hypothetical protein
MSQDDHLENSDQETRKIIKKAPKLTLTAASFVNKGFDTFRKAIAEYPGAQMMMDYMK